jgi:hypothetical protein
LPPQISAELAEHFMPQSLSATSVNPRVLPAQHSPPYCTPAYASPRDFAAATQLSTVAPEVASLVGSARELVSVKQPM